MIDKKELEKLYTDCMAFWGFERQARMLQEECAELTTAISHYLRGRKDAPAEIVEEIADVYLMLNQLISYFGEDWVMEIVDCKSDKIKEKLERCKRREDMVKLEAKKDGKGNIIISEDSFEHLLSCLDNQKFVGESPPNGDALAMGEEEYNKVQDENQACIDDFNRQCRNLLHG